MASRDNVRLVRDVYLLQFTVFIYHDMELLLKVANGALHLSILQQGEFNIKYISAVRDMLHITKN